MFQGNHESTMAFVKKPSQPVTPRKWKLDFNCELEEFSKPKIVVSKPKIRIGVQVIRDFPPGCGIIQDPVKFKTDREREHMKELDNVDSKLAKSFEPKELGKAKSAFGSKPAGKIQYWDPNCSKVTSAQKSEDVKVVASQKEQLKREKISEAMIMFNEIYEKLYLENKQKPKEEKIAHWRVPPEAAKIVKQKTKWIDVDKILGPICGVEVGDKYRFRSQLQMVGLHSQPQSGIDYTKIKGKNLAISIVDSDRYSNERESRDVLFYCGQGGIRFLGSKDVIPVDQKLERGNLAMKNSMDEKNLVRVIRKLHDYFVYDGLYVVKDLKQEKGKEGKMVFMFELHRVSGQPQLHKMIKW